MEYFAMLCDVFQSRFLYFNRSAWNHVRVIALAFVDGISFDSIRSTGARYDC